MGKTKKLKTSKKEIEKDSGSEKNVCVHASTESILRKWSHHQSNYRLSAISVKIPIMFFFSQNYKQTV